MPLPRINGVKGAYLQPPRYGESESGPFTLYTYEGTKTELLNLVGSIKGLGGTWEMEESHSGAKCKLSARFAVNVASGTPEVPVDTWEFFSFTHEKDLLESDLTSITHNITEDQKRIIRAAISNPQPGKSPALVPGTPAYVVYALELHGVRSSYKFVPTIRHTQTVSSNWTVKASLANVGRIITTPTFTTLEALPAWVLFNIPSDAWTGNATDLGFNLAYGWLKMYPTIRGAAFQKIALEQTWVYGLWSTFLYGNPL